MRKLMGSGCLMLTAGLLFWQAAQLQTFLGSQRQHITPGAVAIEDTMPPLVALTTIALGGFRGLIADVLWLRATRMQEEGKYFEIVQLSDWITKLEPRFTPVWSFHAWNMAYNISVLFDAPEDRWRWVQSGFRLLRDEALQYNPGDARLYWELGWIFQHKLGKDLDQAHTYFKSAWATEMSTLFPGRAPNYAVLTNAPLNRRELLDRPGVEKLLQTLEARGIDPYDIKNLPTGELKASAGLDLLHFLQRKRLEVDYKLDPALMHKVDEQFGPLDWRLPQAHAIYWAQRGKPHATGFNNLQLDRMTFQSLYAAFRSGRAFIDIEGNLIPSANLDIIPNLIKAFQTRLDEFPKQEPIKTAYLNFLSDAITTLYAYHRISEARKLFHEVRSQYPSQVKTDDVETFVIQSIIVDFQKLRAAQAQALIEALSIQSYLWYALGDEERSAGSEQTARITYQKYQESLASDRQEESLEFPPFSSIKRQAFLRVQEKNLSEAGRKRLIAFH